ncbi:hypothetical protein GGC47_004477 [Bosea sp. OAE752]
MPKKRHKPEEIVAKLRQVDVEDNAHPRLRGQVLGQLVPIYGRLSGAWR